MHGSAQRGLTGCRSLRRSCSRHMRSVPPLVTTNNSLVVECDHKSSPLISTVNTLTSDSFLKDGRKISVGDCALFKPTQSSPPYIGLIRWLRFSEDNCLQLGVNWLYRPSEIKLGKGSLVDGSPNEIFYSFHEDKIPAASLLHPCKVAFLPKGVALPPGTSSFVCRRVYDIANKCLWWLTDQDYVNDRQEEVDQLLYRTRAEMHASLQPGGRSPKQATGPTSISHVKSASDSGQNSGIPLHSQMKGKKRERGDHGTDQVKKERCLRSDGNDSMRCKTDNNLKSEISRITDSGGLVDLEGVERLIQLMQLDKTERKIDLFSCSILAGVVAATDKADCLNLFVQLRGLPIFDEWLQDVHKGKIGDGTGLKESSTSVDEFLLILLGALDKLPVDLQALQTCSIGRSVNHLRSHKNSEIQRKARSLVDSWKKRVEAEMITNEAKSGSAQPASVWPSKSRVPETSQSGGRTPTGSDAAIKSPLTQSSAPKTASARPSHVDSNIKSSTSPGHVKPASLPSSAKENLVRVSVGGSSDSPVAREYRNSSSNHSQSQSQSSPVKEEARSPATGSATANKMSVIGTRNRKNSGFPVASGTGVQKESSTERVFDVPITEGSSHKLIVKVPNRVRSPAQGIAGASQEDSTCISSRVSSPVLLDRHEPFDRTSDVKMDMDSSSVALENNVDTWRDNDTEGAISDFPDAAAMPPAISGEEESINADSKKSNQGYPTSLLKSGKLHASSFSPMSALMSCVRYSEANSSLSLDDDVGMNLLASVAAGEMSRSDVLSPNRSTEQSMPLSEDISPDDEVKSKSISKNGSQFTSSPEDADEKKSVLDGTALSQVAPLLAKDASNELLGDSKLDSRHHSDNFLVSDVNGISGSSNMDAGIKVDPKREIIDKSNENINTCSLTCSISAVKLPDGEFVEDSRKDKNTPSAYGTSNVRTGEKLTLGASDDNNVVEPAEHGGDVNVPDKLKSDMEVDSVDAGEIHRSSGLCSATDEARNLDKVVTMESKKIVDHSSAAENMCPFTVKHEMLLKPELKDSHSASTQLNDKEEGSAAPVFVEASSSAGPSEMDAKIGFDLNQGFNADEGKSGEPVSLISPATTTVRMMDPLPFSVNPITSGHSTSITVAAAAKGPFVPPDDLLKNKVELGWRGSAATSAFRPAEPRKNLETPLVATSLSMPDASSSKHGRIALDIDLNVPDERVLEEMASRDAFDMKTGFARDHSRFLNEPSVSGSFRGSGGLDLDLNRVDDAGDTGYCSTSSHHKRDISAMHHHLKPFDGLLAVDARRDLDLNNGHGVNDPTAGQFSLHQKLKVETPPQLSTAGLKLSSPGQGSFASWFQPGNSYSTIAIPSVLPDRGEHPFPVFPSSSVTQRTFGPSCVTSFTPEIYGGSVLSSSPAMPFPSSTFQFPLFPFGGTYPLPSSTFPVGTTSYMDSSTCPRLLGPPVHPQLLGPVGSVAAQFQRPYMVALPDNSNNCGLENSRRWGRQDFDLNAGPGATEGEAREEMFPISSGQNCVSSSQQPLSEDQARLYSVSSSGMMKRMEPEGGWDNENLRFKQSSWP